MLPHSGMHNTSLNFHFFLPGTSKDTVSPLGYINSCGGDSNGKQIL